MRYEKKMGMKRNHRGWVKPTSTMGKIAHRW